MTDFDNLERYNLTDHGDYFEKQWWPPLRDEFPAYENFWRKYVVPLTNRINPAVLVSDPGWIRTRAEVPPAFEKMAMCNYSVFYYLARAFELLRGPTQPYLEDIFHLLDSCADNVNLFFKSVRGIIQDLGGNPCSLPAQSEKEAPFMNISMYRDALLHNPVLGRLSISGTDFVPKTAALKGVKFSWRRAQVLKPDQLIATSELVAELRRQLLDYLNNTWPEAIAAFDRFQQGEKFRTTLRLESYLPIQPPQDAWARHTAVSSSSGLHGAPPSAVIVLSESKTEPPEE